MKVIDLVKNKSVSFLYFYKELLWYKTEDNFIFPVPVNDCGDASFLKKDKATFFMRYIRKQLKEPVTQPNIRNNGLDGQAISFQFYRKGYCYYDVGDEISFPISIEENVYLRDIEDKHKFFREIKDFKASLNK